MCFQPDTWQFSVFPLAATQMHVACPVISSCSLSLSLGSKPERDGLSLFRLLAAPSLWDLSTGFSASTYPDLVIDESYEWASHQPNTRPYGNQSCLAKESCSGYRRPGKVAWNACWCLSLRPKLRWSDTPIEGHWGLNVRAVSSKTS